MKKELLSLCRCRVPARVVILNFPFLGSRPSSMDTCSLLVEPSAAPASASSYRMDPPLGQLLCAALAEARSRVAGSGLRGSSPNVLVTPPGGGVGPEAEACRSALSYADVATYEANLGGPIARSGPRSLGSGATGSVPVGVGASLFLELELEVVEDISEQIDNFSSSTTIFRFKGFWPSLQDLHAWIGRVWEPFLSRTA